MNNLLFSRAIGSIGHGSFTRAHGNRSFHSLQAHPSVQFTYLKSDETSSKTQDAGKSNTSNVAHPAGVNSIAIDRFEGRYLLSGGADASIAVWDLDQAALDDTNTVTHRPLGHVSKESKTHSAGVTHLTFYPHDSLAFLSSSYDHHLRLYSSETLTRTAAFDLDSVVYSHAMSPVASSSHLLVACATQHPAVRLVDLNSGSATHSLPGHSGGVMSVAWHPVHAHLLLSGATDGTVRTWDIRRSASALGTLDKDDSVGIVALSRLGDAAVQHRRHSRGPAHTGAANGVQWTADGSGIVTNGHDGAVRLWDASTGANTLVNYGPTLRNTHGSLLLPLLVPPAVTGVGREVMLYPNPRELLVFELRTGVLRARLRTAPTAASQSAAAVEAQTHTRVSAGKGIRIVLNRTTSLAWRAHSLEVYSSHADGRIRVWAPRTLEDQVAEDVDEDDDAGGEGSADRKRKREELDDLVAGLIGNRQQASR